MSNFEIVMWIVSGISLLGTILNANRNRFGFYAWLVTNAFWVVVDFKAGLYSQAALFFAYFILAIVGIVQWKKKENIDKQAETVKAE